MSPTRLIVVDLYFIYCSFQIRSEKNSIFLLYFGIFLFRFHLEQPWKLNYMETVISKYLDLITGDWDEYGQFWKL